MPTAQLLVARSTGRHPPVAVFFAQVDEDRIPAVFDAQAMIRIAFLVINARP
jgi:hypothetical protein